jgi:hypothetical protein
VMRQHHAMVGCAVASQHQLPPSLQIIETYQDHNLVWGEETRGVRGSPDLL